VRRRERPGAGILARVEHSDRTLTLPLVEIDAGLAERLTARLVDRFLLGAGLSTSHRAEAIGQTRIEVGVTGDDQPCELDFALPAGSGNPGGYPWDGSEVRAEGIVDAAADRGIEDVLWDRENVDPTGWELEFDAR
jgi:hypothetical protein